MKIIISPSKTQDFSKDYNIGVYEPLYIDKATKLAHKIGRLSKNNLSSLMKIEGNLLDQAYHNYNAFDNALPMPAISTYTGLVFFHLDLDSYSEGSLSFMNRHLVILSALYGALNPFDGIKPYRLDMKMPIVKPSLYQYWQKEMKEYFAKETVIIDLASSEFSKMVPYPKITVAFLQEKDGTHKNLATYSKMARGQLLHLIIKNQIEDLEALKGVTFEGYTFNKVLSSDDKIVYTRPYIIPGKS